MGTAKSNANPTLPTVAIVLGRRAFLAGAAAAAAAAVACTSSRRRSSVSSSSSTSSANAPALSSIALSATPTGFVSAGRRDRPQVALTFHVNGDDRLVKQLLDVLRSRRVLITAFMVGNWLDGNHELGTQFVADGHEIANHTYTHPAFEALDSSAMKDEVDRCRDAIERLTGGSGHFFRPSGTANGTAAPPPAVINVAAAAGYQTVVGYDLDPADYQDPGATAVVTRTLAAVRPGSIVSLHFGHPGTIDALPRILDGLHAQNLAPVTMSALLA